MKNPGINTALVGASSNKHSARYGHQPWPLAARTLFILALLLSLSSGTVRAQWGYADPACEVGSGPNQAPPNFMAGLTPLSPIDGNLWFSASVADQGLGFQDHYVTLGGLIPFADDELGGMYFTEARAHLSEYGGFFGNIGIGRRQHFEPVMIGVSAWYDFDGDRYRTFGHNFHQFGVSGELIGNHWLGRINGYFPTGTRDFLLGGTGKVFQGNNIIFGGQDSALTGFDAEFGFLAPLLKHWSGMMHFGAYSYSSELVEEFQGMYARLELSPTEMTHVSMKVTNDDRFKTSALLTVGWYLGGSARGTAYDAMLQPTRRNDHIVRYHEDPVIANNPDNSNIAWNIIHVDNTAAAGGTGTFEAPFNSLADAVAAATAEWDIIFIREGDGTTTNYNTNVQLLANQRVFGDGVTHTFNTQLGLIEFCSDDDGNTPTITNTIGNAVELANGVVVSGLTIDGAVTAISSDATVTGTTTVDRVTINNGTTGINVVGSGGTLNFTDVDINTTTGRAIDVDGGSANINFMGNIVNNSGQAIRIRNKTGGTVSFSANDPGDQITENGDGIELTSNTGTINFFSNVDINTSTGTGVLANNNGTLLFNNLDIITTGAQDAFVADSNTNLTVTTGSISADNGVGLDISNTTALDVTFSSIASMNLNGRGVDLDTNTGTANLGVLSINNQNGEGLFLANTGTVSSSVGSSISTTNRAAIDASNSTLNLTFSDVASSSSTGNGVLLNNVDNSTFTISNTLGVANSAGDSLEVTNSSGLNASFGAATLSSLATGDGVVLNSNTGSTFNFTGLSVNSQRAGIVVNNSGTLTVNGAGNNIIATNGSAVDIRNTAITTTFATIQSTTPGAGTAGVFLDGISGNMTVTGGTTVTGATVAGVQAQNITDLTSRLTFNAITTTGGPRGIVLNDIAGFSVNGGAINSPTSEGIQATDVDLLQVANMTIDMSAGNAITLVGNNFQTSATLTNNTTTNTGGFSLQATSNGGGTICINATGNTPDMDFDLNATAGNIGISQANIAAMSTANGTVTINQSGANFSFNAVCPTP